MKKLETIPVSTFTKITPEISAYYASLSWPKDYGGIEACKKIKEAIEGLRKETATRKERKNDRCSG